jgi:hypothetical protein
MGPLQILLHSNPLQQPGLTLAQRLLLYEACGFYWLAIPTVVIMLLPIVFLFTAVGPFRCEALWEFSTAFVLSFGMNRLMVSIGTGIMCDCAYLLGVVLHWQCRARRLQGDAWCQCVCLGDMCGHAQILMHDPTGCYLAALCCQ